MKPRDYCCCAIPVINVGIYSTLAEQFALGIIAGTLSVATPQIVGAATPSFARWLFAIICYVGSVIQIAGFFGVAQEKPVLFRRYSTLHILITTAAFSVAAVWIIISATRHNTAKSRCEQKFFATASDLTSEGETMCEIFPWVDIGLMGGLWVFLAISQFYFYTVISGYGVGQRGDHEKYNSVYSMTGLTSDIPLATRSDPWDSRMDPVARERDYGHVRQDSTSTDGAVPDDLPKNHSAVAVPHEQYSDPYYRGAER